MIGVAPVTVSREWAKARPGSVGRSRAAHRSAPTVEGDEMEGGRWAVVDNILGAALERPPHERETFLQQACADDEKLRRDVESLLAHVRDAGNERPARQLLGVASASGHSLLSGSFGPIGSSNRWAVAEWARCIARATTGSNAMSRSRCFRAFLRPIPTVWRGFSARRRSSRR